MNNETLKQYMMKFSISQLKGYLGQDLIDSLLEWNNGVEGFLSKSRLSEMAICIHGLGLLKDKEFRRSLIGSMPEDVVKGFTAYLPHSDSTDLKQLAIDVSNASWKKSDVNDYFLRMLGYSSEDVFEKKEEVGESVETIESFDKFYELLDYQYIIRQRALNILTSPYGLRRFLIHMPTGTGKTKTATHIICHHYNYNLHKKGLVIWIAHTSELLQQAYDTFKGVWKNIGNGSINMYKLWGDYNIEEDVDLNGFMVCGIQKLQSINNNDPELLNKLISNARLIVYDEAHKASAPETRQVVEKFMVRSENSEDRALMGLSATPGKTTEDSFDNQLLVSMFGNKIIEIDTKLMNAVNMSAQEAINTPAEKDVIRYFQNRGVLSKIKKEELVYEEGLSDAEINKIRIVATANGYDDFSKTVLEKIGKNKSRNLRIMQRLRELNRDKIPTIVFACSVQHGQLLSAMLTLEDIPNALVIGNMSPKERAESIKKFKDREDDLNILINYEVLTTGFDATNIECVFIARPTQSVVLYSQMLGRGLRGPQMGGNEECLLIDVKDNLKQFNENMAFSHFANYWNQ